MNKPASPPSWFRPPSEDETQVFMETIRIWWDDQLSSAVLEYSLSYGKDSPKIRVTARQWSEHVNSIKCSPETKVVMLGIIPKLPEIEKMAREHASESSLPSPSTTRGYNNMANLHVLGTIAVQDIPALSDMGVTGTAGEALRAALAKQQEQNKEQLGNALLSLLQRQTQQKTQHRQSIRAARRKEEQSKKSLQALDRAFAFAQETNNYVPWASLLGYGAHHLGLDRAEFNRLNVIPETFTPKTEEG
jgi:hypothetical protein